VLRLAEVFKTLDFLGMELIKLIFLLYSELLWDTFTNTEILHIFGGVGKKRNIFLRVLFLYIQHGKSTILIHSVCE